MKKLLFYILIPILVIGLAYFVWSKQGPKVTIEELVYENDLAVLNLPHVTENYPSWAENTMFQHLMHLDGLSEIRTLYNEASEQFEIAYDASAMVLVRSSGDVLLAVELEPKHNFFFKSNKQIEKKMDSTTWFVQRKGDLLLATHNKSLLDLHKSDLTTDRTYNFNQLFFHLNPEEILHHFNLPKEDQFYYTISELVKNVNHSLTFSDSKLSASGFDFDESKHLHKLLAGQQAQGFELSPFICIDFLTMKSIQFKNGEVFVKRNNLDMAPSTFDDFGAAEVTFETGQNQSKVMILKSESIRGLVNEFGVTESDNTFGYKIGEVNNNASLQDMFGSYFRLEPNLLAYNDDVIIVAENKKTLQFYLSKLAHNQVWYHSYDQMKWVENELIYNNCTYIAKASAIIHALDKSSTFTSYYNDNKDIIDALPYILVQQSKESTGIYEGLSMVYDPSTSPEINAHVVTEYIDTLPFESESAETLASFDHQISSKPIPVKNHVTGQLQFLLIDEDNVLRLVSNAGKEVWKFKLDGDLVSEVSEIDVFKNKKLQYIFATNKKLYCVDRLGRMVDNFPITLPKGELIQGFSLIDYNQSKNYRLALNSKRNVWLYDINGKQLDGWKPLKFESDLVGNITHYRYRSKDYLLALEKNGKVNVLKRKGVSYLGFPLDTKMPLLTSNVYMDKDEKESKAGFSFISEKGMVMKYGITGSLLTAEKLPIPEDLKNIFIEPNQSNFRYATNVGKELFVFDSKLNQRLKLSDVGQLTGFQSYELSEQDVYVFIFDDHLSIINEKGVVILDDVQTSNELSLYYSSKNRSGYIYYTSGSKLMKQRFLLPK